jgi:transposase
MALEVDTLDRRYAVCASRCRAAQQRIHRQPFPFAWRTSAKGGKASEIREIGQFATKIRQDEAAVCAGCTLRRSNGQTEGQVRRLKLLKRQMYGRAKFDLLRQRALAA